MFRQRSCASSMMMRVVVLEQRIGLRLGQQDAVGHQLDRRVAAQAVLEAHLEADHFAQRRLQFFGDALGHRAGGDAPRLRVADQPALARRRVELAAAQRQRDLGQLRGLARAGLAADDDDLVRLRCARAISSRRAETGSDSGNLIAERGRVGGTRRDGRRWSVRAKRRDYRPARRLRRAASCRREPCHAAHSRCPMSRLQLHLRPLVPLGGALHPHAPRQDLRGRRWPAKPIAAGKLQNIAQDLALIQSHGREDRAGARLSAAGQRAAARQGPRGALFARHAHHRRGGARLRPGGRRPAALRDRGRVQPGPAEHADGRLHGARDLGQLHHRAAGRRASTASTSSIRAWCARSMPPASAARSTSARWC